MTLLKSDDVEEHEKARSRAHSVEQWGAYEILIFYTPATTYETLDLMTGKRLRRRASAQWTAIAYLGTKRAYFVRMLPSKAEARTELRQTMRAKLDNIPQRIDFLEAECARLREALL